MFWIDKIRMKKKWQEKNDFSSNSEAYLQKLSLLTTLEYQVFMLLREGFSAKECSQRLNMKRSDVKDYVNSIYNKLQVRSLAELIVKYRQDGR